MVYGRLTEKGSGEPLAGVTVVVDEDLPEDDPNRQNYEPGLTDADGCYAFVARRTGAITIVAYYADLKTRVPIDRKPGVPVAVDIQMSTMGE